MEALKNIGVGLAVLIPLGLAVAWLVHLMGPVGAILGVFGIPLALGWLWVLGGLIREKWRG